MVNFFGIEIRDIRDDFYILVPEYDGQTFMELAGVRI